jgi:phosphonate transport system substrate-binding protein
VSWAYNEPDSHSGFLVTLNRLAETAEPATYFSRWDPTGFHERSIDMVARGEVGASAIDSHVLEVALQKHPENRDRIRVVDVMGPSTIQPLVATSTVSEALKREVQEIVIALGDRPEHREQLQSSLVAGFVTIDDESYADIRRMLAAAEAAHLC